MRTRFIGNGSRLSVIGLQLSVYGCRFIVIVNQKFENSNMRLIRGNGQLNLRTFETRA